MNPEALLEKSASAKGSKDEATERTPVSPEDLLKIRQVLSVRLAPDRRSLAVVVKHTSQAGGGNFSNLFLLPLRNVKGSSAAQLLDCGLLRLTYGDHNDREPFFSPDGSLLAFLSDRGGSTQVWILPTEAGGPRQLSSFDGQVYGFAWAPDGRSIVATMQPKDETTRKMERADKAQADWRWIDSLEWRVNGSGFRSGSHQELNLVDIATGETRELLADGSDNKYPQFTPDGAQVVFVSNKSDDPDRDFLDDHLWAISSEGGQPRRLDQGFVGCCADPSVSADGKLVAFRYRPPSNSSLGWHQTRLYVVPIEGGEPQRLCAGLDRPVDVEIHNDTWESPDPCIPKWSPDSRCVCSIVSDAGSAVPYRFNVSGDAEPEPLLAQTGVTLHWDMDWERLRLYYSFGLPDAPGEVFQRDVGDRGPRRLTALCEWQAERSIAAAEETWCERDGYRVQGWILRPPDFDPQRSYPGLLYIHGGPHSAYGSVYFHEFQALAGAGIVVAYCNPTGSTGYGEAFKEPLRERWGGRDADDVLAFADHVLAEVPQVEPTRLAIAGGSYGGYLVNWLVGQTDRFACAVSERGVSNMVSHQADADTMTIHTGFELPLKEHAFRHSERFWDMSPLKHAHKVVTPTLFIAPQDDLRVPHQQVDQMYVALKLQGTPARMLVFEGEDHHLGTAGRPDRRIYRIEAIRDWVLEHASPEGRQGSTR